MDPLFIGMTASIIGEVLIGLAVLNVHKHVIEEKRIDQDVVSAMKREKKIALTGVILMILGYLTQSYIHGYFDVFLG